MKTSPEALERAKMRRELRASRMALRNASYAVLEAQQRHQRATQRVWDAQHALFNAGLNWT